MAILRFGPWARRLSVTNPRFEAADKPIDDPFQSGLIYSDTSPVNCANVDWVNHPWKQHVTQYDGDYIPDYYEPKIFYYEDDEGAEYTSEATSLGQAQLGFRFYYQATVDFQMYFNYEINSVLGYGSYSCGAYSVSSEDPDTIIPGSDVFYQGVNKSGVETIDCPAGTIGFVGASISNFGSDYPGDIVSGNLSTQPPPPPP